MKEKFTLTAFLLLGSCFLYAQNKWASKVLEFLPAPGQFTNEKAYPAYAPGDDAAAMAAKATAIIRSNAMAGTTNNLSVISLGAYGGYVIVGFDHPVMNKPYAYDCKVHGNWFDGNAEAGIVMVSRDANGNGLADDEWYELAGSDYYNPATVHNYIIKYGRPNPVDGNVRWTDNQGNSGAVLRNIYHTQASYYPMWFTEDTLQFRGTRLMSNAWNTAQPPQQYWRSESFGWGYADNQANSGELSNFDLDWAVDINGNKVKLDQIDFIKIYTGLIQDAGWLGETSTEFSQAEDLHPEFVMPPVFYGDVHIVKKLPVLSSNTHWTGNSNTSFTDDTITFHASFSGSNLQDGFTYSNETIAVPGNYTAAAGKGIAGNTYIVGYYNGTAANTNRTINFNDQLPHGLQGVYVNNTAATVQLLATAGLVKGDYVKLVAKGLDANGNATGTRAEFTLADYNFLNSTMNYVVKDWCWMDLSSLGSVSALEFVLESNRSAILPTSYCLDQLVSDLLAITLQPVGNPGGKPLLCDGSSYTLSTAAAGTGITYQWYRNDTAVTNATAASLVFTSLQVSHSGMYYCMISNGKNKARTKVVQLLVNKTTKLLQDLPSALVEVPKASQLTLSIKAEGDNLSYLWYKGNPAFPKNAYQLIAQALNATATTPNLVPAPYGFVAENNGYYVCTITGTCGKLISDTTEYKTVANPLLPALTINKRLKDTSVCFGTAASFIADATGATSYTWQKKGANGAFSFVTSVHSATYTNPQITLGNFTADGEFRCLIKQDADILYTDTPKVTVLQPLAFVQPAAIAHLATYTAVLNRPVNMEVQATGFTPTSYQWYYKAATDADYTKLGGATTKIFTLAYATAADAGKYRCEVKGALGTSVIEYTLAITSSISRAPVLYNYTSTTATSGFTRPNGLFIPGEKAYFNAAILTGYTCKWYKDGVPVVIPEAYKALTDDVSVTSGYWGKAATGNIPWLYIKNIAKAHAGSYVLETTDADGNKERSTPILIIVDPEKPEITNLLQNKVVNEDETVTLALTADGKGFTPAYQWYHDGVALMGGTLSPFVTAGPSKPTYSFTSKTTDAGSYYCIVTTPGGADTSNTITVTVNAKVKLVQHPADQVVLSGTSASFTVSAAGSGITYQWMKNGLPVTSATSATYTINAAVSTDEGVYSCVVKAAGLNTAESGAAYLAVITSPVTSGYVLCNHETQTRLEVQTQLKFPALRYQWFSNGKKMEGATSTWVTVNNAAADTSAWYCQVTNSVNGTAKSIPVHFVHGAPLITGDLTDKAIEGTSPLTLTLTATGDSLHYQWFKEATALAGETKAVLTITGTVTSAGAYYCEVSNACSKVTSKTARLTVGLHAPAISIFPNPASRYCIVKAHVGNHISVYNQIGILVYSSTMVASTETIPVTTWADGIYYVYIREGKAHNTFKLIKGRP
jgi:hypothetical protein